MLGAQQRQLLQTVNQELISIRNAELTFYINFYAAIGNQAAIIGGFTYASLNQANIPGSYAFPAGQTDAAHTNPSDKQTLDALLGLFWVSGSVCMGAALHCVLCTILLQIFGPGLALLGPIGSMAKANKGLNSEMKQVFVAYIIMIVCFSISTCLSFWVCFDLSSAIASTLIYSFWIRQWWFYCFRIYNKMFFHGFFNIDGDANVKFDDEEEDDDPAAVKSPLGGTMYSRRTSRKSTSDRPSIVIESHSSDNNTGNSKNSAFVHTFKSNPQEIYSERVSTSSSSNSSRKSKAINHKSKVSFKEEPKKDGLKRKSSMIRSFFGGSSSKKVENSEAGTEIPSTKSSSGSNPSSPLPPPPPQLIQSSPSNLSSPLPGPSVIMEGYMSKRIHSSDISSVSTISLKSKEWENQYFVLYANGNLFYYKGRQDFRVDASKNALNDRPIVVSMYKITFSSPASASASASDTASVISDASTLRIVLRPKKGEGRDWSFRLDTENDFELWVQALSKFSETVMASL